MAGMQEGRTGRPARVRPLVAPSAVRSWARREGVEVGGIFDDLDDHVVTLYLAHLTDGRRATPELERAGAVGAGVLGAAGDPGDHPCRETVALEGIDGEAVVGPAPCPRCAGPGYLEFVDLVGGRQHQRCRPCGVSWSSEIALATLEHASR